MEQQTDLGQSSAMCLGASTFDQPLSGGAAKFDQSEAAPGRTKRQKQAQTLEEKS